MLGLHLSEDAHLLLALIGVSSHGHRPQPAGGTAVLLLQLLIIHPVQLGTTDKSHEIAFVLQLEDLHFMGIPFFLHITDELPTVPYCWSGSEDFGALFGLALIDIPCRSMGRCSLALPLSLDFSEHKGELLLVQPSRDLALLQAGGFVASWLLYPLSMSLPSFPPSSRAKPSAAPKSVGEEAAAPPNPNTADANSPLTLFMTFPFLPSKPTRSKPHALLLGPSISHPGSLQGQPCSHSVSAPVLHSFTATEPKYGREGKANWSQCEAGCYQASQEASCAPVNFPK